MLPAAAITFLVVIGVQFQTFEERYDGATDMIVRGPLYQRTASDQFVDWLEYVLGQPVYPDTWLPSLPNVTHSQYASPLCTIPQELWSSSFLFLTIVGLSRVKPSMRLATIVYVALLSAWSTRREISCFLADGRSLSVEPRGQEVARCRIQSDQDASSQLSGLSFSQWAYGWLRSLTRMVPTARLVTATTSSRGSFQELERLHLGCRIDRGSH